MDKEESKVYTLAEGYRTESGRPLMEADENEYIIKPDGSKDFGEISEETAAQIREQTGIEIPVGKIRLRVGNTDEGLIHAKKHENQVQPLGIPSIESMIDEVALNYDAIIYQPARGVQQRDAYSLLKIAYNQQKHQFVPMTFEIEGSNPQGEYSVLTAFPMRERSLKQKLKKDRLIYCSPAIAATIASSRNAVTHDGNSRPVNRGGMPTSDKSSDLVNHSIPQEVQNLNTQNSMKPNSTETNESQKEENTMETIQQNVPPPTDKDVPVYESEYANELAAVYDGDFLPEEDQAIKSSLRALDTAMQDFAKEEENGLSEDVYDTFEPMHEQNVKNLLEAQDIRDGSEKDSSVTKEAVKVFTDGMEDSTAYIRQAYKELKEQNEDFKDQIIALQRSVLELERQQMADTRQVVQNLEGYLKSLRDMQQEIPHRPRKEGVSLTRVLRDSVKEAYYTTKNVPSRIKLFFADKKQEAADKALQTVSSYFDRAAKALLENRDNAIARTRENLGARDLYKSLAFEDRGALGEATLESDTRIAERMASLGVGETAIAIALKRESSLQEWKKDGKAEKTAKAAKEKDAKERAERGGEDRDDDRSR